MRVFECVKEEEQKVKRRLFLTRIILLTCSVVSWCHGVSVKHLRDRRSSLEMRNQKSSSKSVKYYTHQTTLIHDWKGKKDCDWEWHRRYLLLCVVWMLPKMCVLYPGLFELRINCSRKNAWMRDSERERERWVKFRRRLLCEGDDDWGNEVEMCESDERSGMNKKKRKKET